MFWLTGHEIHSLCQGAKDNLVRALIPDLFFDSLITALNSRLMDEL